MSRTRKISKQATNINYTGPWTSLSGGNEVLSDSVNRLSSRNTQGTFGVGVQLANRSGAGAVNLQEGTHFQYGKRLDASISEDPVDGFGGIDGGIYDTEVSGSFTANKYFRLVYNLKNIKNPTGLNITKVYAKNLNALSQANSPSNGQIFIDPINGKYLLPRPIYWSKCSSLLNIVNAEIIGLGVPNYVTSNYGPGYITTTSKKFGNGIIVSSGGYVIGNASLTAYCGSIPNNFNKGTLSVYLGGQGFYNYCYSASYFVSGYAQIWIGNIGIIFKQGDFNPTKQDGQRWQSIWLMINGNPGPRIDLDQNLAFNHYYLVWDRDGGLTGGKTAKLYINGILCLETSTIFNNNSSVIPAFYLWGGTYWYWYGWYGWYWYYWYTGLEGGVGIDNIKIWNHVVTEDPAFEYNGGIGRENALHIQYIADGYIPNINQKASYFYLLPDNLPVTSQGIGTPETETLRQTPTINGAGIFGDGGALFDNAYSIFSNYSYGKRLDAKATEDPIDGYGTVTGGVVDTSLLGTLDPGKYIRLVDNGVNIKNANYPTNGHMGLKVYAMSIPQLNLSQWESPPPDRIYVDPATGRFVFPRPIYWSKCETIDSLTKLAEINTLNASIINNSGMDMQIGKFNNALHTHIAGTLWDQIKPIGTNIFNKGTLSCWVKLGVDAVDNYIGFYLTNDNYDTRFLVSAYNGLSNVDLYVNKTKILNSVAHDFSSFVHVYIIWDTSGGLSLGRTFMLFLDGVLKASSNLVFTPSTFFIEMGPSLNGLTYNGDVWLDNIKIWNHVVTENPEFEYNSGIGREDSIHAIYKPENNYKPDLSPLYSGVGYYRGSTGSRQCIIRV